MSVRVDGMMIHIVGNSPVEDAEPILTALQDEPDRTVDLSAATRLHSAVAQILIGLRPKIVGSPSDPFQVKHLMSLLWINDEAKVLG